MLVERTREDGRGELLIPSRVIFWVAGILFFLSFLSYDIIDFPGMKKESPTSWHLLAKQPTLRWSQRASQGLAEASQKSWEPPRASRSAMEASRSTTESHGSLTELR